MKIYLDLVVILNFLVDFLLLLGTNRLSGFPASPLRAAAAAALGALYSGVCMMPRLLWRIVSLAGMAAIAFGWDKSAWKRSGVFVLLSMALGGASLSIGRGNFLTLLLTAGGVWALCIVAFGGRVGGREYVPVELTYGGKTVSIVALRDSGNTLRDPISGEQVLVVSGEVAERLTRKTSSAHP